MSITHRRLATACVAACLATGLSVAPAASAADGNGTNAVAAQKKKAKAPTTRKLNTDLKKVRTRTTKAEKNLRSLNKTLESLQAMLKTTDGKANTLLTAAPQLITGLTQLGDAVTKQIVPGLTALSTAVQTQIAPGLKQAGDSITSLAVAQEYGVVQAFLGSTPIPGAILNSSDIPDDSNGATLTGTFTIPVPDTVTTPTPITLRAAIRSGEDDGTGADDPVGVAGLVAAVAGAASPNVTVAGGGPGGSALQSNPNPQASGLPVYPIAVKAPRVDETPNPFAFPAGAGQSIDLTANLAAGGTPITVDHVGIGGQGFATINFTARFHDLTASATDLRE